MRRDMMGPKRDLSPFVVAKWGTYRMHWFLGMNAQVRAKILYISTLRMSRHRAKSTCEKRRRSVLPLRAGFDSRRRWASTRTLYSHPSSGLDGVSPHLLHPPTHDPPFTLSFTKGGLASLTSPHPAPLTNSIINVRRIQRSKGLRLHCRHHNPNLPHPLLRQTLQPRLIRSRVLPARFVVFQGFQHSCGC